MQMKIISFNIRSVSEFMRSGKGNLEGLFDLEPDVLFLQETHIESANMGRIGAEFAAVSGGLYKFIGGTCLSFRSSGLLAFVPIASGIALNLPDTTKYPLFKGRVLEILVGKTAILNVYGLHSGMKLERLATRVSEWDVQLRTRMSEHLAGGREIVIFGDLNVVPEPIDLANPKSNGRRAGFTKEERESWAKTCAAIGLSDVYRRHHSGEVGRYSFWTARVPTARANNSGWRLDTAWATAGALSTVSSCDILTDVEGSDHAPLQIIFTTS